MRRRRVLGVIDNLGSGGAQRQLVNLIQGLSRMGHQTAVFTYARAEGHFDAELRDVGIGIENHPRGAGHPLTTALRLKQLLQEKSYEAIISFMPAPSLVAGLALLGARSTRLVVSERSSFPSGRPTLRDRLMRLLYGRADCITANSHHQAELIRRHLPRLAGRLTTIYNGYDTSRFRVREWTQRAAVLRVVAVGRIMRGKNIENLVQALRLTRQRGHDIRLDWIGRLDNVRWSTGYYRELSALLDASGVGAAWRWLGERKDVPELLADYDALIHPSFYEGLPNAVCEAFAAGLPVLASGVCDHPLLVAPPRRGVLFEPGDVASIADALTGFASLEHSQRRAMGLAAREYALTELSLERMCTAYNALLQ